MGANIGGKHRVRTSGANVGLKHRRQISEADINGESRVREKVGKGPPFRAAAPRGDKVLENGEKFASIHIYVHTSVHPLGL